MVELERFVSIGIQEDLLSLKRHVLPDGQSISDLVDAGFEVNNVAIPKIQLLVVIAGLKLIIIVAIHNRFLVGKFANRAVGGIGYSCERIQHLARALMQLAMNIIAD